MKLVSTVNYLARQILNHKNMYEEAKIQISNAIRIAWRLTYLLWTNKYMTIKNETRINKTTIRLIWTSATRISMYKIIEEMQ